MTRTRLAVTERELAEVVRRLLAEEEAGAFPGDGTVTGAPASAHLTDLQYIHGASGALPPEERRRVDEHLAACPICAREMARVRALSPTDADLIQVRERLAAAGRRRATPRARRTGAAEPRLPHFALVRGRPAGAYAEGAAGGETSEAFAVTDGGGAVAGLQGILSSRDREHYVRVDTTSPEGHARFADRAVLITIVGADDPRPILRRRVDVGVTALLGTDLKPGTVTAELLPAAAERDAGERDLDGAS